MIDYENDLAFKPAMTWEELCEWLKEKFDVCYDLRKSIVFFPKQGNEISLYNGGDVCVNEYTIAELKTPEQMKTIIEALYGED